MLMNAAVEQAAARQLTEKKSAATSLTAKVDLDECVGMAGTSQFGQMPASASPKFLQALDLLIQAHVEELARASKEEPVREKPPNIAVLAVPAKEQSAAPTTDTEVPSSKTATPKVGQLQNDTSAEAIADGNDGAPQGCLGYVRSKFGFSISAHGHTSELSMFGNAKDQLKDSQPIDEKEYDVSDYYATSGCSQAIARSDHFSHLSLAFISLNAIYLGVDSDYNKADSLNDADLAFIICENIFCFFFTFEVLVRFAAFQRKRNCLRDLWFKFDSLLVFIMVVETWVIPLIIHVTGAGTAELPTGPIKLLRLLRLARMVRIMRAFPELMTMVKGMMVATKPVSTSMAMLVGIIYVFAIIMHMLLKDWEGFDELYEYWGTISRCMMTLSANGTLGDSVGTVMRGIASNAPALFVFYVFVILSAVTVANMLIGVLCEVVGHVAEAEKENAVLAKLKTTLLLMLKHLDEDGSGDISKHELLNVINDSAALEVLEELDINVKYFVDMIDMIYESTENCTIPDIMQLLLDNQGQRTPNLKDIVLVNNFTRWSIGKEIRREVGALRFMLPTGQSTSPQPNPQQSSSQSMQSIKSLTL